MSNEAIIEKEIENESNNDNKASEVPKKDFKDSIYGKIDVSVETMDKFIFALLILLGISIILGVIL